MGPEDLRDENVQSRFEGGQVIIQAHDNAFNERRIRVLRVGDRNGVLSLRMSTSQVGGYDGSSIHLNVGRDNRVSMTLVLTRLEEIFSIFSELLP